MSYRGALIVHADGATYSYLYGSKNIAALLQNYHTLLCGVFASIGGVTFGYDH